MKTIIHSYNFDVSNADEKKAYAELRDRLVGEPGRGHWMKSCGGASHYFPGLDGMEVELETKHLFDNQWNTGPIDGITEKGLRVFDWAEDAIFYQGKENKRVKRGHYLIITDEMKEIRRNTNKCGYCGHQERAERGLVFCDRCLDSPYLKEKDLHLLRMMPVDAGFNAERAALTTAEREHLMPIFIERQTTANSEREKKRALDEREDTLSKYEKAIAHATARRDGMLWLLDHHVPLENVIYYDHTGVFCFGWRGNGVDPSVEAKLKEILTEFPSSYEIKCADGRKLSAIR